MGIDSSAGGIRVPCRHAGNPKVNHMKVNHLGRPAGVSDDPEAQESLSDTSNRMYKSHSIPKKKKYCMIAQRKKLGNGQCSVLLII